MPVPRAIQRADLPALKTVLDATEMFPSRLLEGMLEPFLVGERPVERWQTVDRDRVPVAIAYSAPEPMTDSTSNLLLLAVHPGF